jgi:hypothetical protein
MNIFDFDLTLQVLFEIKDGETEIGLINIINESLNMKIF